VNGDYIDLTNLTIGFYNKLILSRVAEPKKRVNAPINSSSVEIKNYYQHLKLTRFDSFFRISGVDVPKCFERSKSLRRKQQSFLFLRMVNFYMRHGLRLRSLKLFNNIFYSMSWGFLGSSKEPATNVHSWQQLFTILTSVSNTSNQKYSNLKRNFNLQGSYIKKHA